MQYLDERVGPEANVRAWIPNLNFLRVDGSGGKVGLLLLSFIFSWQTVNLIKLSYCWV